MVNKWTPLKKIREDIGVTQKMLKGKGLDNISRLERGEMTLTYATAAILKDKLIEVAKEKNPNLGYEITVDLLLNKTEFVTLELIKRLKDNRESTDNILMEIDEKIESLDINNNIKLLTETIQVLAERKDKCKYSKKIKDYCYKLIKLNISRDSVVVAHLNLIKAHYNLSEYESVIAVYKIVEQMVIETYFKEQLLGITALAHFELEQYIQCEDMLNKIDNYSSAERELFYLTKKASCNILTGKLEVAENIYCKVLDKSIEINNNNYLLNTYSNLIDIYLSLDNINKATELLNKAEKIFYLVKDKQILFNASLSWLIFEIRCNNKDKVKEVFNNTYRLATEMSNSRLKIKALNQIIQFYKEHDLKSEIYNLIMQLTKEYNSKLDSEVILGAIRFLNDSSQIRDILNSA